MTENGGSSLEESGPFVVTVQRSVLVVVRASSVVKEIACDVGKVIWRAWTHGCDFSHGFRCVVDAFRERLGQRYQHDRPVSWVVTFAGL